MQLNNVLMMGTVVEVVSPNSFRLEVIQKQQNRERLYKGEFAVTLEKPARKVTEGDLISISGQLVGRTSEADPHILAKTVTRHSGSVDTHVNKVVLVGIASDPTFHAVQRGINHLARLQFAVGYGVTTEGRWQTIPTQTPLVLWGALARMAANHLQKQREIGVVGYLTNGTKPNGEGRWEIEVAAEQVKLG